MTDFHSIGLKLDANGVAIGVDQVTKSITDLGIAEDKTAESTRRFSDAQSKQSAVIQTAAQQAIKLATETQQKITDIAETAIAKNMALQQESINKILAMQIKAIADRDAIIRKAEAEVISIKETAIQKHMDLQVKANEKLAELGRKDKDEKIAIQNKLQQDIDKLQIAAIAKYESVINTSQTRILAISEAANVKRIAEETKLQNKIDKLQVDAISNRDAALIKSSASEVQIAERKAKQISSIASSDNVYSQFNVKSYEDRVAGVKALTEELNRLKSMHVSGGVEALAHAQTIKSLEGEINKMTLGSFNARGEFHQMISKMAMLTSEITRVIFGVTAMAAAFAAPAIIGGKYLKDMEDLKLGITSVVLAMGTIDGKTLTWGQASQVADEQMKKLQNTAMFMAGTTQDLAKAFQAVATQGLEAGMSIDQIRTIAIAGVAAGRALGISATTLQRDIRDMVLGIRPNSTILSASLGITKADIDAARASAGGLFEYLDGKLKGFIVASAQYNKTFTGMFEQMSEMFSRALSESSQDIFKGAKESMIGIMDMIGSINKKTGEFTVNPEFKMALDIILVSLNAMLILIVDVVKSIGFIAEGWMKLAILVKDFHFGDLPSVPSTLKEVNSELEKTKKLYASGFTLGLTNGTQDTQQLSLYITELEKAKIVLDGVAKVSISDNVTALAGKMNELHAAMKASGGAFLQADEAEQKLLHTHEAYNFALTEMAKLEKQYAAAKADTNTKSSDLKDMEKRLSDVRDTTKAVSESIKWEDALSAAHTRTLSATTDHAKKLAEIDEKTIKEHESYAGRLFAASSLLENLKVPGSGATDKNIQEATKEVTRLKSLDLAVDKQRALALADLSEKELAPAKKLIESLKEKTTAQEIDLMVVGKQTELQKESAKWLEQVSNGTYKGTEAQKIETAALYEGLLVREQTNIAMEEHAKTYKKVDEEAKKSIETIDKQIEKQKLHNEEIGKTPEQIALVRAAFEEAGTRELETYRDNIAAAIQFAGIDADIYAVKVAELNELIKKRRELAGLEAAAAPLEADKKVAEEQKKQQEKLWKDIDGFAHTAFNNITMKGKSAFAEIGKAIKESILDMLYKMTIHKWIFQIGGVSGGVAGAGAAGATGMFGGGGSSGGLGGMGWLTNFSGNAADAATKAGVYMYNAGAQQMGGWMMENAATIGNVADVVGTGMGYVNGILALRDRQWGTAIGSIAGTYLGGPIGGAIGSALGGVLDSIFGFGGGGSTPTRNTGNAAMQFNPQGTRTGMQTYYGGSSVNTDATIMGMQTSYMQAAMALGIGTVASQFNYGGNTGRNGQSPNFALGGGAGGVNFYQSETTSSDAAIQLAAKRAVFAALQGSQLPTFLAKMFDGLSAGAMTGQQITDTLAFAGSVKQMRDALLETRTPLEVMRANVQAGTTAFATSAATFRTDFVAAIDKGINPTVFAQWQQLGTAIDQLAAADAEKAKRILGWQQQIDVLTGVQTQRQVDLTNALTGADASTAALITQLFGLQDAAQLAKTNLGWQQQIDVLTGTQTQRQIDLTNALTGTDASTAGLITQLFGLQDAAQLAKTNLGWQQQIDVLTGTQTQRQVDLANALNGADASTAALITTVFGLQDAVVATAQIANTATKMAEVQNTIINIAMQNLKKAVDAQKTTLKTNFDAASKIIADSLTAASNVLSKITAISQALNGTLSSLREMTRSDAQSLLRSAALSGNLPSLDKLTPALASVSKPSQALFTTFVEYQRDQVKTANDISMLANIADKQVTETQSQIDLLKQQQDILIKTYEFDVSALDLQITKAQEQIDILNGINTSVLTVALAITALKGITSTAIPREWGSSFGATSAQVDRNKWLASVTGYAGNFGNNQFNNWATGQGYNLQSLVSNAPKFADGINEVPYDMVANIHAGEEIKPKAYVDKHKAANDETRQINSDMRSELAAIRQELVAIKSTNYKMWQIEDKHDIEGVPSERLAA